MPSREARNVIDNDKVVLKDELESILPKTSTASIAVGYFFISGFAAILKALKETDKIKLLISDTTDQKTAEALIAGFKSIKDVQTEVEKKNLVNEKRKVQVISENEAHYKKSLEYMEQTTSDKTVVEELIELMKNEKIEVRVYPKEKLHAKAYLLESKDSDEIGTGIVGSSNLSIAGISTSSELNLKTKNDGDVIQLLEWFDKRWEVGLPFTDKFNIILEKSWAGKTYSPHQLFLKAAYHEEKEKIERQHQVDPVFESTFPPLFKYQKIAVDHALTMFELRGGVIIADVVGIGKTYVGTALLKYLQREYRPLIICPPHLQDMWERFCTKYEIDAKFLSDGRLSQEKFSLYQNYKYSDRDLVLIDESHHFRNNDSRRYENLKQFMVSSDAKAILLTATPFSNKTDDLKNQIMLFHTSDQTNIPPANEIGIKRFFQKAKEDPPILTELLKNIMIRRTRRYILNTFGITDEENPKRKYLMIENERKYFPERKMYTLSYDIDKVYSKQYQKIVDKLGKGQLTFARYSPGLYLRPKYVDKYPYNELKTTGPKLVALIRHLLLKRMESSQQAFRISVEGFIRTHQIFLGMLNQLSEKGIMPIGDIAVKDMYQVATDPDFDLNDDEQLRKIANNIINGEDTKYKFDAFNIENLIADIENDLEIFHEISDLLSECTNKNDDKLHKLQELLNENSGKKILVFSEFSATIKYLHNSIKWRENKERVYAQLSNSMKAAQRFDPEHNPSDVKIPKAEQLSLVFSTDVLSEGVNLHAGQVIINYDFHWNPVRLIQRAGRIDRLGSKNELVTIHNFLPDPKIEQDLGLKESVGNKINEIQQVIGEDYKILTQDEVVNDQDPYVIYRDDPNDTAILDREDVDLIGPSENEKLLNELMESNPKDWEEFKEIPDGIRSSSKNPSGKLILVCEHGKENVKIRKHYLIDSNKKVEELTATQALDLLKSDDDSIYPTPSNYDELLAVGWKKFNDDIEQKYARDIVGPKTPASQKYIVHRLIKIAQKPEFQNESEVISELIQAFRLPLLREQTRELKKLQKNDQAEPDDSILFVVLKKMYVSYGLSPQIKKAEMEIEASRILYSRFLGKADD